MQHLGLDFAPNAGAMAEGWSETIADEPPETVGASYYAGELVLNPQRHLSRQKQLELLETHPLFTGRCPKCGHELDEQNQSAFEWYCNRCGWSDAS